MHEEHEELNRPHGTSGCWSLSSAFASIRKSERRKERRKGKKNQWEGTINHCVSWKGRVVIQRHVIASPRCESAIKTKRACWKRNRVASSPTYLYMCASVVTKQLEYRTKLQLGLVPLEFSHNIATTINSWHTSRNRAWRYLEGAFRDTGEQHTRPVLDRSRPGLVATFFFASGESSSATTFCRIDTPPVYPFIKLISFERRLLVRRTAILLQKSGESICFFFFFFFFFVGNHGTRKKVEEG